MDEEGILETWEYRADTVSFFLATRYWTEVGSRFLEELAINTNLAKGVSYTEGYYVNTRGVEMTYNGLHVSDYISVDGAKVVYLKSDEYSYADLGCVYDSEKQYLRGLYASVYNNNFLFLQDEDKYIRLNSFSRLEVIVLSSEIINLLANTSELENIKEELNLINESNDIGLTNIKNTITDFTENHYIKSNTGEPASFNGVKYSDYIDVVPSTEIEIDMSVAYNQTEFGAFYDKEGIYVAKFIGKNVTNYVATVPENAYKVRINVMSKSDLKVTKVNPGNQVVSEIVPLVYNINNNVNRLNNATYDVMYDYFLNVITDVLCVGDSITDGHVSYYPPIAGRYREYSYPTQLAKMTGWNITNAGVGGINPQNWWANEYPKYDYTDYQLILIKLGTNGGLSDTFNEDVEIFGTTDYTSYAETSTGCLSKIISAIKQSNPNAIIIFVRYRGWTENSGSGKILKQITDFFSIPYINLNDTSLIDLSSDLYHGGNAPSGNMDYLHYSAFGYAALAKYILYGIMSYFYQNQQLLNGLAEKNIKSTD